MTEKEKEVDLARVNYRSSGLRVLPQPSRTPATPLYRQLIQCLELRRRELKWTFEKIDEVSGLQRGYAAKCWHPDTKTGRQAGWPVLQWVVDAMYPNQSFRLFLVPEVTRRLSRNASPMARLFAALALAGFDGFQAARLLADAGIEIDANGAIIRDPAKAQKRRDNRRALTRRQIGSPPTKALENVAAQPLGRFG